MGKNGRKNCGSKNQQAEYEESGHKGLCKGSRALDYTEREDSEDGKEDVLRIPDAPLVFLQASQGICRVQRGF